MDVSLDLAFHRSKLCHGEAEISGLVESKNSSKAKCFVSAHGPLGPVSGQQMPSVISTGRDAAIDAACPLTHRPASDSGTAIQRTESGAAHCIESGRLIPLNIRGRLSR